jgi:hypothetical protein
MSQLAQAPPSCPQPLRLHLLTEPIDRRLGATPSVRDVQCCQRHLHNTQCAKDHGRIDVSHMGDAEPLAGELAGTAAAYSGPLIFEQLKLDVEKTFIPHQIALEQMRTGQGDMAAVVFVTSKPVDAFQRRKWDPGFKFLAVPFEDFGFYLPSTLTSNDYPDLIPQGQEVETIAIPTILAAFNWQKGSDRYRRVARLTDYLFSRLDKLQGPGFHPKWKDVNLSAKVPGLDRFPAAQEWLDRANAPVMAVAAPGISGASGVAQTGTGGALSTSEQRLFQEFLVWRRQHGR